MTSNNVEGLFQEIQELKVTITTMEEKIKTILEKKEDELKTGDRYWAVSSSGAIVDYLWDNDLIDKNVLEQGGVFKTQEEAEFEVEKRKVLHELKKLSRPFKCFEDNYMISLYHDYNTSASVIWSWSNQHQYGNYHFDTVEEVKQSIEKIGENRIKKYLFNVED